MIDLDALEAAMVAERTYPYDPLWLREYVPSLIAELRASRNVVDRARIRMNIHGESPIRLIYEIDQAVKEYDKEFEHVRE